MKKSVLDLKNLFDRARKAFASWKSPRRDTEPVRMSISAGGGIDFSPPGRGDNSMNTRIAFGQNRQETAREMVLAQLYRFKADSYESKLPFYLQDNEHQRALATLLKYIPLLAPNNRDDIELAIHACHEGLHRESSFRNRGGRGSKSFDSFDYPPSKLEKWFDDTLIKLATRYCELCEDGKTWVPHNGAFLAGDLFYLVWGDEVEGTEAKNALWLRLARTCKPEDLEEMFPLSGLSEKETKGEAYVYRIAAARRLLMEGGVIPETPGVAGSPNRSDDTHLPPPGTSL